MRPCPTRVGSALAHRCKASKARRVAQTASTTPALECGGCMASCIARCATGRKCVRIRPGRRRLDASTHGVESATSRASGAHGASTFVQGRKCPGVARRDRRAAMSHRGDGAAGRSYTPKREVALPGRRAIVAHRAPLGAIGLTRGAKAPSDGDVRRASREGAVSGRLTRIAAPREASRLALSGGGEFGHSRCPGPCTGTAISVYHCCRKGFPILRRDAVSRSEAKVAPFRTFFARRPREDPRGISQRYASCPPVRA